jgi:hypothetical protein
MHGPWYPHNHHKWSWEQEGDQSFVEISGGGIFRYLNVTKEWFIENVMEPEIKRIKSLEGSFYHE